MPAKFYAITDSDGEAAGSGGPTTRFAWNAYHIENYLLEPRFILKVLQDLNLAATPVDSIDGVTAALCVCAEETIPTLVGHSLQVQSNRVLLKCLDLGFDRSRHDVSKAIAEAASSSEERIRRVVAEHLTPERLKADEAMLTTQARAQLTSGQWRSRFRGRDVLRRFVNTHLAGMAYEPFRDLIAARMRDGEFEPLEIKQILEKILNDPWTA